MIKEDEMGPVHFPPENGWKISRTIPSWGVFLFVVAVAASTVSFYFNTIRLGEKVEQQNVDLKVLAADIRSLTNELNRAGVADASKSADINELRRRVTDLENRFYEARRVR